MPQLEVKIHQEIEANTYVIAWRFPFPTWVPDNTFGSGVDTVWLYKNPVANITIK